VREVYKSKMLSPDRVLRLTELGFQWRPHELAWEEMFASLADYKRIHGHCNVPDKWQDNPRLGIWCTKQRQTYKDVLLSPTGSRSSRALASVGSARGFMGGNV
jgi:hypothetical protein